VSCHSAGAYTATLLVSGDGKCNERGWACTPPPLPAWANFTLLMECTPESSRCYSVYSVVCSWTKASLDQPVSCHEDQRVDGYVRRHVDDVLEIEH
jgi:hypothetical protein